MSVATSLSRVTGFVRTWATGFALGAGILASSYTVANNIPNMIFELVAGGILSALFIPTFMEVIERRTEEDAWRFASHVLNLALIALGAVAVIGTLLPHPFIWTQTFRTGAAPGGVRDLGQWFFRFFAVQVVIYGGGMVVQALLNARRRYLWTALGPVFNNLVVIATMLAVAVLGKDAMLARIVLAVGTTLGVAVMFGVMVPELRRAGFRYTPELGLSDPDVRRMLTLAVPTLVYVITNLVAVSFRNASALAVTEKGSALIMYAWNFYQLPYGILAVALATAVFTEMSAAAGRSDLEDFKQHFTTGLRTTFALILPSAGALFVLARPLVTLYRAGAFRAEDVAPVALLLRYWSVTLIFFAAMMFTLRAFYSLKDTRTPAIANLALSGVQVGLYLTLTTGAGSLRGLGVAGIPVADGVFYALMLITLSALLRKKLGGLDFGASVVVFGKMALASIAGAASTYLVLLPMGTALSISGALVQITVGGLVCFAVALAVGRALGVREVAGVFSLLGRVTSRFRRS